MLIHPVYCSVWCTGCRFRDRPSKAWMMDELANDKMPFSACHAMDCQSLFKNFITLNFLQRPFKLENKHL